MSDEDDNKGGERRQPPPLPQSLPPTNVDPEAPEWVKEVIAEARHRKLVGMALGVLGIGTVAFVLCHSMHSISGVFEIVSDKEKAAVYKDTAMGSIAEHITWVAIGGHAIIAVAAVFFGYSMLRAAERLLVPRHLLAEKKDVEVIRAILGMDTPASAALTQAKALLGEGQALLKGVVDIVRPGSTPKPPEAE